MSLVADPIHISISIRTDAGCVRETNEDAVRSFAPTDPAVLAKKGRLIVVADGMGGHSGGEVASSLAVEVISNRYFATEGTPRVSLQAAFEEANSQIYAAAMADSTLQGMGTTATALVLCGEFATAAHVGDSRLYLLRDDNLYLMTEDHSAVREMVKVGLLTPDEARKHEDRNVILRAIGTNPQIEVSFWESSFPVRAGDWFIVCSDGLHDVLDDHTIRDLAVSSADAHTACEKLVEKAKILGGYDNITVAVIRIEPLPVAQPVSLRQTREVEVPV